MSDKEPHITVKIKVDREELDCAIRDVKSLYEKNKRNICTHGRRLFNGRRDPPLIRRAFRGL